MKIIWPKRYIHVYNAFYNKNVGQAISWSWMREMKWVCIKIQWCECITRFHRWDRHTHTHINDATTNMKFWPSINFWKANYYLPIITLSVASNYSTLAQTSVGIVSVCTHKVSVNSNKNDYDNGSNSNNSNNNKNKKTNTKITNINISRKLQLLDICLARTRFSARRHVTRHCSSEYRRFNLRFCLLFPFWQMRVIFERTSIWKCVCVYTLWLCWKMLIRKY